MRKFFTLVGLVTMPVCLAASVDTTRTLKALLPVAAPERLAPAELEQNGRVTLSPGFSPDGRTIYFAQSACSPIEDCPQRLKRSHLTPQGWSAPEFVPLPSEGRVDFPSVSPDGRKLLFSWATKRARHNGQSVYEDFDLYSLDLTDPNATPRALDMADINRLRGGAIRTTRYINNENAPVLTRNGDLYFWTERLDGVGERDVYRAAANGRGGFLNARALPAPINSRNRDDSVWVSADGKTMFVTYMNRGGQGSADIFVSRNVGGRWSLPRNLGPLVNSPYNDFAARISPDGRLVVFSSDRPITKGEERIFQVWKIEAADVAELRR